MKIAQIAPVIEKVPPLTYGGTERVVAALTDELVKLGHDVTLFATGNSNTSAKLESIVPLPLRKMHVRDLYGPNQYTMLHIGNAYQYQNGFDIIHDHNGYFSLPTANIASTPVVMSIHGAITPLQELLFSTFTKPYLVSISYSQVRNMPKLNVIDTVHHGLDMIDYSFSVKDEGYLLYVGRFSPEKGIEYAIEAAEFLGLELILAAKLDIKDQTYFDTSIKPRLSKKIRWIGEVDQNTRNLLMSKALCFLHSAIWEEPFGLTLIEAQACGCPVVAFNHGSIPEIIEDGKTGFIVQSVPEMIKAITKIKQINRLYCRKSALDYFSAERMALEYEAIYHRIKANETVSTQRRNKKLELLLESRS